MKGFKPGTLHPRWRGGRSIATNGYVLIRRPEHPRAMSNGYVYEHIMVAETKIGRPLLPEEIVHHINEVKTDNRPENLEVVANREAHLFQHRKKQLSRRKPGEPNPTVPCACGCGAEFLQYDTLGRPRLYVSGHNILRR